MQMAAPALPRGAQRHDARSALRQRTRAAHDRVDAAFGALDLGRDEDYVRFLQAHAAAHRALLFVWPADLPLGDDLSLIERDLAALGSAAHHAKMRVPTFRQGALGAAYVVAGSHFGKRVLRRERTMVAGEAGPLRYLSSLTTQGVWRTVLQRLNDFSDGEEGISALVSDATATFELFGRALSRVEGP